MQIRSDCVVTVSSSCESDYLVDLRVNTSEAAEEAEAAGKELV